MLDRLLNEIIREIIQYAYTDRLLFQIPVLSPCHLPPFVASQVCRTWRHALLSDPTMWTCIRIPQMKPDGVKEMLHRSARAPLHVFVDTGCYYRVISCMVFAHLPGTLRLIFEHIGRFRTLHIELFKTHISSVAGLVGQVLPYLSRPAPLLRSFYLRVQGGELFEDEAFVQTLFSGHPPNLQHVYRRISAGFDEVLRSPLFRNLSSLHFDLEAEKKLHFDSVLDILELSPVLKTFEASVITLFECHSPEVF